MDTALISVNESTCTDRRCPPSSLTAPAIAVWGDGQHLWGFSDENQSQEGIETAPSLSPAFQTRVRSKEPKSDGFVLHCGTGRLFSRYCLCLIEEQPVFKSFYRAFCQIILLLRELNVTSLTSACPAVVPAMPSQEEPILPSCEGIAWLGFHFSYFP